MHSPRKSGTAASGQQNQSGQKARIKPAATAKNAPEMSHSSVKPDARKPEPVAPGERIVLRFTSNTRPDCDRI